MPNEATSFREAVAENLRDVFLGQDHAEETVTYAPPQDTAREITVRVLEAKTVYIDREHSRDAELSLTILVENHATRGINDPEESGCLYRGVEPDLGDGFDFREIVSEDVIGGAYTVRYARELNTKVGPRMRGPL